MPQHPTMRVTTTPRTHNMGFIESCNISEYMLEHYLPSVPRNLGFILWAMVVKVGYSIQPHHIDPVGHEVQVEHGQGP